MVEVKHDIQAAKKGDAPAEQITALPSSLDKPPGLCY